MNSPSRFAGIALVTIVLTLLAPITHPASAQSAPAVAPAVTTPVTPAATPAAKVPIVLGILDGEKIMNESLAGKSIRTQTTALQKALDVEVQKLGSALRAQLEQIEQQKATMPQKDYEAKQAQIKAQDDKIRQDTQNKAQAIQTRFEKAKETLLNAVKTAVDQIVQQRGLTLILNKSLGVVMSAPGWDITTDVMQRVNKALPKIKV